MKVQVGFVHLHAPLFFARKNWKEKIDTRTDKGPQGEVIRLEYDTDDKELKVNCGDHVAFIPSSNVVSYSPTKELEKVPVVKTTSGKGANPKITAQVSGPHDHVFAQGPGKTRD